MKKGSIVSIIIGIVLIVIVYGIIRTINANSQQNNLLGTQSPQTNNITPVPTTPVPTPPTNDVVTTRVDPDRGPYLADYQGLTLYTSEYDPPGTSVCTDDCEFRWPPYKPGSVVPTTLPPSIGVITRPDGSLQYAVDNKPLYYFYNDEQPGDVNGDNVGGIWHIVKVV